MTFFKKIANWCHRYLLCGMRVNKVHIISLNIRKSIRASVSCPCVGDRKKGASTPLFFFLPIVAAPLFSPSHLVDAHVQVYPYGAEVLALCTDKLESSMLYDRFIRGRLVRRFKNGRRAPRLPFFIPRFTLFCFLISRRRPSFRHISFIFDDCGIGSRCLLEPVNAIYIFLNMNPIYNNETKYRVILIWHYYIRWE